MTRMKSAFLKRLAQREDGTSVVEFGLLAMPLTIMIMGVMDLGHTYYVDSVMNGAMHELARDSSLEGASLQSNRDIVDARLRENIRLISPDAQITITRRYYKTFSKAAAAQAEDWTDANSNGRCDNNEPFIDGNNNTVWDADGGDDGQGGSKDIVIVRVAVQYRRLFPTKSLIGLGEDVQLLTDSILANQPYANQANYGVATTGNCP
jgi:Flp pilus assembly pilin Flp